jgi:hypothetical protein
MFPFWDHAFGNTFRAAAPAGPVTTPGPHPDDAVLSPAQTEV